MDKKEMTFAVAMRDFFGLPSSAGTSGKPMVEFLKELRHLNDEYRAYFKTHLEAVGYTIMKDGK